ncbi:cytosolic carboxypeptidase 6-like [Bolinopsis microptera]|uniref:cytosolic carboxypeptidase 6-like n=1 Tax=Bolinopsis microptera TaxID=2820187 RepID=UPI00307A58B2
MRNTVYGDSPEPGEPDPLVSEEVVGNVSKLCVLPPGYRGPPRKGHLIFDANFESGNLGRVDYITELEYDIFIRPDTCNPRFRVWFYFTVENVKSDQRVIFNIVNFSKTKSLYREGMSPVVRSTSRPKWQRVPGKNVFYYKCPDHRKNYVMSFAFQFDREDDVYEFAYCFPYTNARLSSWIAKQEERDIDYFYADVLCDTVQQRNLDIITITSPDNIHPTKQKRVIFITARVHPGESPSSYVCEGLMEFILEDTPEAKALRDHIVFKFVPMLNPDGVALGNYRCSLMGFDLNRHWTDPSRWAHPTLEATKALLLEYNDNPSVDLDFYIDIHAHSTLMNGFMYGNVYDDNDRFERQAVFPKLLCNNAEDFSLAFTSFNKDAVKAGTGRRFLGSCLSPRSNCYTLEVSFYSYTTQNSQVIPYSVDGYISLGRNVAKTFLNYYQLTPVTTPPTATQLMPPVNKSKLRAHIRDEVLMVHRQRNNTSKTTLQTDSSRNPSDAIYKPAYEAQLSNSTTSLQSYIKQLRSKMARELTQKQVPSKEMMCTPNSTVRSQLTSTLMSPTSPLPGPPPPPQALTSPRGPALRGLDDPLPDQSRRNQQLATMPPAPSSEYRRRGNGKLGNYLLNPLQHDNSL